MEKLLSTYNKLLFGIILVLSQSCYIDFDDDGFGCVRPRGPRLTETHVLPDFTRITNAVGADITLRQSTSREFRITAAESILNRLSLRVINDELIIDSRNCINNAHIEIFMAIPDIESVQNIGSGDIFGDNAWEVDHLELRITGSGSIDTEFVADFVYSEIAGSGRLNLFGEVDGSQMRISGSGDVYAFNLLANQQNINISGSGNCEIFAREALDVRISGSGNVYYKGNPQVTANISGSGSVINAN